jgi:hypothetical protein
VIGAKEITQKASPEQIEIVVVQLKDPKSFRPYREKSEYVGV